MADNIQNDFQVKVIEDDSGPRLKLINALQDEVIVEHIRDPRVRVFVLQSVIMGDPYLEVPWEQRPVWAAEQTTRCLEQLEEKYGQSSGCGNQNVESQVVRDYAPEYSREQPRDQIPDNRDIAACFHDCPAECSLYHAANDQGVHTQVCGYADMGSEGASITLEPFKYQDSVASLKETPPPTFGLDGDSAADSLGSEYCDAASITTGLSAPTLADEMEVDQIASVEGTSGTDGNTAGQAPTADVEEEPNTHPFVADMQCKFSEDEWVFLIRICVEYFQQDLRKVEEKGGELKWIKGGLDTTRSNDHKTRRELMAMALCDPRVTEGNTDYTVTQFDGQLYERMLVGWSQRTIEHTLHAFQTDCFDKPQARKDRRKDPDTGKTKKSKTVKSKAVKGKGRA